MAVFAGGRRLPDALLAQRTGGAGGDKGRSADGVPCRLLFPSLALRITADTSTLVGERLRQGLGLALRRYALGRCAVAAPWYLALLSWLLP